MDARLTRGCMLATRSHLFSLFFSVGVVCRLSRILSANNSLLVREVRRGGSGLDHGPYGEKTGFAQ